MYDSRGKAQCIWNFQSELISQKCKAFTWKTTAKESACILYNVVHPKDIKRVDARSGRGVYIEHLSGFKDKCSKNSQQKQGRLPGFIYLSQ